MIIVQGNARLGAGEIERLRSFMVKQIKATRAEPGCEHYAFAVDISDPQLLHISERWTDNAAIAAHFQSAHMAEFNALLGNAKIEALSIKAYEGDFSRTLTANSAPFLELNRHPSESWGLLTEEAPFSDLNASFH